MPPKKKGDAPSKKTVEKKKEKVIEDKTFGLKNKKGKKQQQFIKNVTSQVKYGGSVSKEKLASMEYQTKKEQMKKDDLGSILKPVAITQHVSKDADPKSVLCVFFKQGQCMKGDRCKFSHDLSLERKTEKRNLYVDSRDTLENDTIDTWDENKLQEVVDKKHGSSEKSKPKTEIVCKHFLQAIEKGLYGWFWTCPNGGDKCIYRHALPPGFVFKKAKKDEDNDEDVITIEELVEQERNKLATSGKPLTKVTLETFLRWKERKLKDKQDKEASDLAKKKEAFKAGKTLGVSGREVFEFNPTLVMEDDDDDNGEVVAHHYGKDEASSEGIDLTGISVAGGGELLGAVGGCSAVEDVNIDEELFQQELNDDDDIPVDEELFNEEITDLTINGNDDEQ